MATLAQTPKSAVAIARSALPPDNGPPPTTTPCPNRTHAVQQSNLFVTSLPRASNGRLMSGLRLPADAAMASAPFGLGPEAHQES
jgi:hypothetical protein